MIKESASQIETNGVLSRDELALLARVDQTLEEGVALKNWWETHSSLNSGIEYFELTKLRPGQGHVRSFRGIFTPPVGASVSLVGYTKNLPYTRTKPIPGKEKIAAEWVTQQMQRFSLRYFLRVSNFSPPQTYPVIGRPNLPHCLQVFSWCPREGVELAGVGFRQLYYKDQQGNLGRFPRNKESAIVDLQDFGKRFKWILVQSSIHDHFFRIMTQGPNSPRLDLPLNKRHYLILSQEMISNRENPSPDQLGIFGPGLVLFEAEETAAPSIQPAVLLIRFQVLASGETIAHNVFICRKPSPYLQLPVDPTSWYNGLLDFFLSDVGRRNLRLPQPIGKRATAELIKTSIDLDKIGKTAHPISSSGLDLVSREFLFQQMQVQKRMILGSLQTWNQVPDWMDTSEIPRWAITGNLAKGLS